MRILTGFVLALSVTLTVPAAAAAGGGTTDGPVDADGVPYGVHAGEVSAGADVRVPLAVGWPAGTGELLGDGRIVAASRNIRPAAIVAEVAGDLGGATEAGRIPAGDDDGTVWGSAVDGDTVWLAATVEAGMPNLHRWRDGTIEEVATLPSRRFYELTVAGGTVWVGDGDGRIWPVDGDGDTGDPIVLADLLDVDRLLARGLAADDRHLHVGVFGARAALLSVPHDGGDPTDRTPAPVAAHVRTDGVYTVEVADGTLAAGTVGTDTHTWLLVGDADGDRPVDAVRIAGQQGIDQVAVGGAAVYATSRPDGHLWQVIGGQPERVATPVAGSETRMLTVDGSGTVVGLSAEGVVWRADPTTGQVETLPLTGRAGRDGPLPAHPHMPMGVGFAGNHLLAGGNWNVTVHRPDGTIRPYDLPGEPKDIAGDGRHGWLALYPTAELWLYRHGSRLAGGGLHRAARWDPLYNRPEQVAVADTHMLVAAHADSTGTGALIRIDSDGTVAVHREPFGDHMSVASVAAGDHNTAYLAGGLRGGDQHDGSLPVAAVDTVSGTVRWQTDLDSDARRLRVAAAAGTVAVVDDDRVVLLDRTDGTVADEVALPAPAPGQPTVAAGHHTPFVLLLATSEGLTAIDLADGTATHHGGPLTVRWPFGWASPTVDCDGTVVVGDDGWQTTVDLAGTVAGPATPCPH